MHRGGIFWHCQPSPARQNPPPRPSAAPLPGVLVSCFCPVKPWISSLGTSTRQCLAPYPHPVAFPSCFVLWWPQGNESKLSPPPRPSCGKAEPGAVPCGFSILRVLWPCSPLVKAELETPSPTVLCPGITFPGLTPSLLMSRCNPNPSFGDLGFAKLTSPRDAREGDLCPVAPRQGPGCCLLTPLPAAARGGGTRPPPVTQHRGPAWEKTSGPGGSTAGGG